MAGKPATDRPFRIFDEKAKNNLPHRCYLTEQRAIDKALTLLYWLALGNSYTVYDSRSGRAIVQFTRRINGIYVLKD